MCVCESLFLTFILRVSTNHWFCIGSDWVPWFYNCVCVVYKSVNTIHSYRKMKGKLRFTQLMPFCSHCWFLFIYLFIIIIIFSNSLGFNDCWLCYVDFFCWCLAEMKTQRIKVNIQAESKPEKNELKKKE